MSAVTEEKIENADAYFKSIVDTVREPLLVLDPALRVKTANRSFYVNFAATADETLERYIYDLGGGQWNIPALRTLFEKILQGDEQFNDFEIEHDFARIGRRSMLLNARRIRGENAPNLILLAFEDVTNRRETEEKLRVFAEKLERSNRELQNFAQVASHDLQEPLRKIQAFGDCLKIEAAAQLNEDTGDYLERMLAAAARMRTLINDLLAFAQVETKAQPFAAVDLERIAREVVVDLESAIEDAGASVQIGRLAVIDADPTQMRQLLQNLIGNSLKYRHKTAAPVVKVYGETIEAPQTPPQESGAPRFFRLVVEDNGIGFDEKYLDRIFNVFQRLHGRGEYEGTGVGLAVCRKIAEYHGGDITARSEPGAGAAFIVRLPVAQKKSTEQE